MKKIFPDKKIRTALVLVVVTLILPFRKTAEDTVLFGYPFDFVILRAEAFSIMQKGFHSTIIQFVNINISIFLVNVLVIYVALVLIEKIQRKYRAL